METIIDKSLIFVKKRATMGTVELKSELIGLIQGIEDNKVLNAVYVLLTRQLKVEKQVDFWNELPEEIKNDIDEAIAQGKRGEGISHKQAMKQIREKLEAL